MNFRGTLGLILLIYLPCKGLSQDLGGKKKTSLHLTIDNDAFLFSQTDQYYSSGLYARYQTTVDPQAFKLNYLHNHDDAEVIRSLSLNHQIYTPIKFNSYFVSDYDRPHAALLYLSYGYSIVKPRLILTHRLDIGWMGPSLHSQALLNFWHDVLGYKEPRGWDFEINDSPVAQLYFAMDHILMDEDFINIGWQHALQAGTIYTNAKTVLNLRLGKLRPLHRSMHRNLSFLDRANPGKKIKEWYTILQSSIEGVLYNATIQGNLIGEVSPHTEDIEPWILHHQVGVGISWQQVDIQLSLNYRSVEVKSANRHKFVQIKMNHTLK